MSQLPRGMNLSLTVVIFLALLASDRSLAYGAPSDRELVGVIGPLTPTNKLLDSSPAGKAQLQGVILALEDSKHLSVYSLEADGKSPSTSEPLVKDDQATPSRVRDLVGDLVSRDVIAIVGSVNSECTAELAKACVEFSVPCLTPISIAASISADLPRTPPEIWWFRVAIPDSEMMDLLAFHIKQSGIRTVAAIYANKRVIDGIEYSTPFETGLHDAFKRAARRQGLKVVTEIPFTRGRPEEIRPQLEKLAASTANQAVALWSFADDGAVISKELRDLGSVKPVYASPSLATFRYGDRGGDPNVIAVAPFSPADRRLMPSLFVKRFIERFGIPADMWSGPSYDAVGLIDGALDEVTDRSGSISDRRQRLRDTLLRRGRTYLGVTGTISFAGNVGADELYPGESAPGAGNRLSLFSLAEFRRPPKFPGWLLSAAIGLSTGLAAILAAVLTRGIYRKAVSRKRRYKVAISYASEDLGRAEDLAAALKRANLPVFFDRNQAADLWGKDLSRVLNDVYGSGADYIVILVSRHYVKKFWTSTEFRATFLREGKGETGAILPVLLDSTPLPGITPHVSTVKWKSAEQVAALVVEKLQISS